MSATLTAELAAGHPWPALEAYTPGLKFCGRDADLTDLVRRLRRRIGTVLYGQSGLGKTSLLQAGLVPLLEADHYLPVSVRLIHKEDAPPLLEQVRTELSRSMEGAGIFEAVLPRPDEDLWRFLHRRDVSWLLESGHETRPVLIFDQFEEIFTNGQSTPELARRSRELFAELANLVQGRLSPAVEAELAALPEAASGLKLGRHDYHLLLVVREDFLAYLDTTVERFAAPDFIGNRQRLLPFDGVSALAAVEGPGEQLIEPGVAEKIVRKVAAARQRHLSVEFIGEDDDAPLELADLRVEPALLSLMCSRLNERRLRQQEETHQPALITAQLLEGTGGQVLDDFYSEAVAALPRSVREPVSCFIEEKLISEGGRHRQQVVLDSARKFLKDQGVTETAADEAFAQLVKSHRLLRIEDRGDVPRIELTHDVLCAVVGRCRDARRAKLERLKWWKNAGAAAAVALFFGALVLGIYAWRQRLIADEQAEDAQQQRTIAEKRTKEAVASREESEKKGKKATDNLTLAMRNMGRWYEQRIKEEAGKRNLAAASLLWSGGAREAEIRLPQAVGFVAAPPSLQPLGRVSLSAGAKSPPVVKFLSWLHDCRTLVVQTDRGHLALTDGVGAKPRWLTLNESKSVVLKLEAPEAERAAVRCAIAWRDKDGREGLLASLTGQGLWFLPGGDGAAAHRWPAPVGEVTALAQSPDAGGTWAGLENGLVVRLNDDATAAVWETAYLCKSRESSQFDNEAPLSSPGGHWRYEPAAAREDTEKENVRGGAGAATAKWSLGALKAGKALPLAADLTQSLPSSFLFTPDDRRCLLRKDEDWQVIELPVPEDKKEKGAGGKRPTAYTRTGSFNRCLGGGSYGPAEKPLPSLRLEGSAEMDVSLLNSDWLLAFSETELNAYNLKDGKKILLNKFDAGRISQILPLPGGDRMVIVLQKEIVIARVSLGRSGLLRTSEIRRITVSPAHGKKKEDSAGIDFDDRSLNLMAGLLAEDRGIWWRMRGKTKEGWIREVTSWVSFDPGAAPALLEWEQHGRYLPPNRVGALRFDAQAGLIAVSVSSGIGMLDPASSRLMGDMFLSWPNPEPERLMTPPGRHRFSAPRGGNHRWQLAYEPYVTGEEPSATITVANRSGVSPGWGDRMQARCLTWHPSGELTLTGGADGSLKLYHKASENPAPEDLVETAVSAGALPQTAAAFSPDGLVAAVATQAGEVRWYRLKEYRGQTTSCFMKVGETVVPPRAVWAGEGKWVLSDAAGLHRWNPADGTVIPLPLPEDTRYLLGIGPGQNTASVLALVRTNSGRLVLFTAGEETPAASGDLKESAWFQDIPPLYQRKYSPVRATLVPGGGTIAVFGEKNKVELWRHADGRLSPVKLPPEVTARWAAFSPTGVLLGGEATSWWLPLPAETPHATSLPYQLTAAAAVAGTEVFLVSSDKTVKQGGETDTSGLWLLNPVNPSGPPASRPADVLDPARSIEVSPDGLFAVVVPQSSDRPPVIIDARQVRVMGPLHSSIDGDFSEGAAISPDGSVIAGLSEDAVRVWSAAGVRPYGTTAFGLAVDHELQAKPRSQTGPDESGEVPDADRNLATAYRALHKARLTRKGGGHSVAKNAAAQEAETSYQRLQQAARAIGPLDDTASLPAAIRQELETFRTLPEAAASGARQLISFLRLNEPGDSTEWLLAKDLPVAATRHWPTSVRGDLRRVRVAAELKARRFPAFDAKMIAPDGLQFRPEFQQPLDDAQPSLVEAFREGGFVKDRLNDGKLIEGIMKALQKEISSKSPDKARLAALATAEAKWRLADVLWNPRSSTVWTNLGITLENLKTTPLPDAVLPPAFSGPATTAATQCYQYGEWLGRSIDSMDPYSMMYWGQNLKTATGDFKTKAEKDACRQTALSLAREAVQAAPRSSLLWHHLSKMASDPGEKLMAAERRLDAVRDAAGRLDAQHSLGTLYREHYRPEAIEVFEEILETTPDDVYTLVEVGEIQRSFRVAEAEWRPWFKRAVELDAAKELKSRDLWGRLMFGRALEQFGHPEEAAATYLQAQEIDKAEDPKNAQASHGLAGIYLSTGHRDKVQEQVASLREDKRWTEVAWLARRWKQEQKGDATADEWVTAVLQATADKPGGWRSQAVCFTLQNRPDEAAAAIARHVEETPEEERKGDSFQVELHLTQARLSSASSPAEALWHLAVAAGHGWQDEDPFVEDPALHSALEPDPNYRALRSALLLRYDEPARYTALAQFITGAAGSWRAAGKTVPPEEEAALAARPLEQAIRLGWQDEGKLLSADGEFKAVAAWAPWPERQRAAREKAFETVFREAHALARAWGKARRQKSFLPSPAALPAAVLETVPAHRRLKRQGGRDLFGNSYVFDAARESVTLSPSTAEIARRWHPEMMDNFPIQSEAPLFE